MALSPDRRTRTVRNIVEPVAGVAFFAPEVHDRYEALGFPNPSGHHDGVKKFDWPAYFAARAACLSPPDGRAAAAAFGVFPESRVAVAVDDAMARVGPEALLSARLEGTILALERLLGRDERFDHHNIEVAVTILDRGLTAVESIDPMIRPLFAGLRALSIPGSLLGRWWRLCDQYREHRMDAHVEALADAGLNGCEACLLNDARQGLALGSYVATRGWTRVEIDESIESLRRRSLVDDTGLTAAGREFREAVEVATDRGQQPIVDAMGEDLAVFEAAVGWQRQAIIDGFGYPGRRFVENTATRARRS